MRNFISGILIFVGIVLCVGAEAPEKIISEIIMQSGLGLATVIAGVYLYKGEG